MSGILGQISGTLGGVNQLVQTAGSVVNDVASLGQSLGGSQQPDSSGASWSGGSWAQQLQPGSWRGVGFVLDAGDTAAGRRVAIHEYPYRDTAWAEDLGKLPRRFSIQAYLTGDDVYQQRDAMVGACEQPGPGTLVHPTLGSIQCVLLEFQVTDRRERGRYIEVQFSFILAGDVQFPSSLTATLQNVGAAIDGLNFASGSDLGAALSGLGNVAGAVADGVGQFTAIAQTAVGDASRIFNSVRGLQGYFGRFDTGSRSTLQPVTATVQSALAVATTARSAVYAASNLVNTAASFL
jgi:prophage DNA circulation protein